MPTTAQVRIAFRKKVRGGHYNSKTNALRGLGQIEFSEKHKAALTKFVEKHFAAGKVARKQSPKKKKKANSGATRKDGAPSYFGQVAKIVRDPKRTRETLHFLVAARRRGETLSSLIAGLADVR